MSNFTRLFFAAVIIVCAASCTKETLKYEKMPDNGSVQIKCPDTKGN